MYDPQDFDDFDTQIQPEELQDDNPIDQDYEEFINEGDDDGYQDGAKDRRYISDAEMLEEFDADVLASAGFEYDEGSDRDNWEEEQVFQDHEW